MRIPMFRHQFALALPLLMVALLPATPQAQCILSNPSFEIRGSGGAAFGGWNQFGPVGVVTDAYHGQLAARVSGPNTGGWEVAGFWQSKDSVPGEQWEITGHVLHPSSRPLVGDNVALVNVEWRDAGENLIDYESFTVATSASSTDEYAEFSLTSGPAPTGTASVRLLLGVLQSPTDPAPDVYYDQATLYSTSSPTIDDVQWNDFPGGRTVDFGGHSWRVKGPGYYGPGPNLFCDNASCVFVDGDGRLHLTLQQLGGNWYSTEVTTEEALGYGDYILTTVGRLDTIDPQVVLGIFLWQYELCWDYAYLWWNPFNEIDIEYSRWGNPASDIAQFVAQPFDWPGNIDRFDATFADDEIVSHAIRWLPDRVEYRVWRGGPEVEAPENIVHAWTYTGPHIPRPEQPRMHLNLWRIDGSPAGNQEIVFDDFTFVPQGGISVAVDPNAGLPSAPAGRLQPLVPNPFNPRTSVRFGLTRDAQIRLDVYDLAGRLVRTIARGRFAAGEHEFSWEGRDDEGRRVGSGVYLFRLSGPDFVETRRGALLK